MKKYVLKKLAWITLGFSALNFIILVGSAISDKSYNTTYLQYSVWFVIPALVFLIIGVCFIAILLIKKRW